MKIEDFEEKKFKKMRLAKRKMRGGRARDAWSGSLPTMSRKKAEMAIPSSYLRVVNKTLIRLIGLLSRQSRGSSMKVWRPSHWIAKNLPMMSTWEKWLWESSNRSSEKKEKFGMTWIARLWLSRSVPQMLRYQEEIQQEKNLKTRASLFHSSRWRHEMGEFITPTETAHTFTPLESAKHMTTSGAQYADMWPCRPEAFLLQPSTCSLRLEDVVLTQTSGALIFKMQSRPESASLALPPNELKKVRGSLSPDFVSGAWAELAPRGSAVGFWTDMA